MDELDYVRFHARHDADRAMVAITSLREAEALNHTLKYFRPYQSWRPWFQRHALFQRRARKLAEMQRARECKMRAAAKENDSGK